MSYSDGGRHPPERRAAIRVRAQHPARLQFVTSISGGPAGAAALWPSLICVTRDMSEAGIGLEVPALRDDDDGFFGVDSPVHVTLGLPTGVVQVRGLTARYARGGGAESGFVVAVSISEMKGADAERFRTYLRAGKWTA